MKFDLISTKSIISEYLEDIDGDEALNVTRLRRIANDTIQILCHHEQMQHMVALLEVSNYKAAIPENFGYIIQVAYRNQEDCHSVKRLDLVQWVGHEKGCEVEVNVKCERCHEPKITCGCNDDKGKMIINVDELWRGAPPPYLINNHNPHFKGMQGLTPYSSHIRSNIHSQFRLIRPHQHSFHNADKHIKGCLNLDYKLMSNEVVEYSIENGQIILNQEKGQILLAYFAHVVDEYGFRMMPNRTEYIEAVKWAIEEKEKYKIVNRTPNNANWSLYNNAKAEKSKYFSKCRDLENIPSPDEFKAMWRNMAKVNPNFNAEYNFFKQSNDKHWSYFRNQTKMGR